MRRFEAELGLVAERLELPQPERGRILDEISADLDALRRELIERGLEPDAAEAEALALLTPSEAAIVALVSVHEPLYRSLLRRFSSRLRLAEWIVLVGVSVAAIAFALGSLAESGVLRRPSLFLAPVLLIGVGLVAIAGRRAIALFLERDHDPARLRSGLTPLLFGSASALLVAFAGVVFELARLTARLEADPQRAAELLVPWLLDSSVLVGSGLMTALVGGLCWFLLLQKVSAVEQEDLRTARATGLGDRVRFPSFDASLTSTGAHR